MIHGTEFKPLDITLVDCLSEWGDYNPQWTGYLLINQYFIGLENKVFSCLKWVTETYCSRNGTFKYYKQSTKTTVPLQRNSGTNMQTSSQPSKKIRWLVGSGDESAPPHSTLKLSKTVVAASFSILSKLAPFSKPWNLEPELPGFREVLTYHFPFLDAPMAAKHTSSADLWWNHVGFWMITIGIAILTSPFHGVSRLVSKGTAFGNQTWQWKIHEKCFSHLKPLHL